MSKEIDPHFASLRRALEQSMVEVNQLENDPLVMKQCLKEYEIKII